LHFYINGEGHALLAGRAAALLRCAAVSEGLLGVPEHHLYHATAEPASGSTAVVGRCGGPADLDDSVCKPFLCGNLPLKPVQQFVG
jgi:hypothetical protein